MDFQGPEPADYHNVRVLNQEFLTRLRGSSTGKSWLASLATPLRPLIPALSDLQVERLSAAPFLLFSLRESDTDYWGFLPDDPAQGDLLAGRRRDGGSAQLAMASLAFLWQLARRNSYAVRLVSGASLSWCERLADCTLLHVLRFATSREDLLRPRRAADLEFWNKLLGPGTSSQVPVRSAAQLSALQSMLARDTTDRYPALRAAACTSPLPSRRVAEKERLR